MCQLFAGIPPRNYESETRSVRLGGHATSIRLEIAYWRLLEELAASQKMPLGRFLTTLYDEVIELHGEVRNFTSLLRCACLLHLEKLMLSGDGAGSRRSESLDGLKQHLRMAS